MKKIKSLKPFVIVLIVAYLLLFSINVRAEEINPYEEPVPMQATAYCDYGITKSGEFVRVGICAMQKELIGKTAIVYSQENGIATGIIGIYEIKDTGGDYRIKNGSVVDIYMENYEDCVSFGRQEVLVQIVVAFG